MKKRVLFVIPDFTVNGVNSSLLSLIHNELLAKYIEFSIFPLSTYGEFQSPFEKWLIKPDSLLNKLFSPFRKLCFKEKINCVMLKIFKRIAPKIGVDVILNNIIVSRLAIATHYSSYDTIVAFQEGDATFILSKIDHHNKIAWIHGAFDDPLYGRNSIGEAYTSFSKIVCVSEYSMNAFSEFFPVLKNKTCTIRNMFDYHRILSLSKEKIEDARFVNDKLTLIFVGRLSSVKRFNLIPIVARSLVEKGLDFRWYLCGSVFDDDLYDCFYKSLLEYELSEYVIWLGPKPNPYPYLLASDIFVTLSKSETCPMVFNEAKLLGIKIASTDFPTAREFLVDYPDSIISSIDEMADSIISLSNYQKNTQNEMNEQNIHLCNETLANKVLEIL